MQLSTALEAFKRLEECKVTDVEGDPPTYDVRLDAKEDDRDGGRKYSVRASAPRGYGGLTRGDWQYVIETAVELDTDVDVENDGIVLR